MTLSRHEALDPKMNQIARAAILRLVEEHAKSLTAVLTAVGSHLHECDNAALDDHLAAAQRLTKSLGASGL